MDVGDWLRSLGLSQYEAEFRRNDIDAEVLLELTDADLEKIGVSLGHRKRLLKAIVALGSASSAPVVPPAPADAAERRQLTVMFCDLVGSTSLSARLDPEDMRQVIRAYQDAVSGVVARYDGFVAKFMGDGVLAYFGFPRAHEDDAARAVHAGLEITEVIAALQTRASEKLAARVGIATGLVVVGDIVGEGPAREQAVVGDTPNLAARLQGLVEAGGVAVASATRRLLGDRFRLTHLGKHVVKGLAEPVEAWAALGVTQSESRFEAAQTARLTGFVGREAESADLLERQRRAWDGQGQVVLISGEAGIGKSRLSAWLGEQVAETAHTRLRYQCSPYHRDTALHPFVQQVERAAGIAPREGPETKLEKLEKALVVEADRLNEVAPLFAAMLSIPFGDRYPSEDLSPDQLRGQTLSTLVDQIEGLTRKQPVFVLFEDAHWADPTSVEVLNLVIERVPRLPMLLLITVRPEFEAPWKGRADIATVALGRFDPANVEALVQRVTGGRKLPAEVVAQIVAKTDGVPLFVEELTKNVLESGLLIEDGDAYRLDGPLPPLAIPATLQDSLMARLDRLAPVKEIAQIGAAIGREFGFGLLHAVVGGDEASLKRALAQLEQSELVFRSREEPDAAYSFKHALVQDTAYESLLKSRRQVLHRRIAKILETQFPSLAETEPEILAHHFSRADLAEPARLYHERAGDRAVARSASAEAVAHFEAALAQISRTSPGEERNRGELELLLKLGPAVSVVRGVQSPDLEKIYRRAYDIAKAMDGGRGLFKSVWGLWHSANTSGRTALARDRAEELLALGKRSGEQDLILEAFHCRWSTTFFRGDVLGALAHGREGIKHYDHERHGRLGYEFGGHNPGACAHAIVGGALALLGNAREAAASIERGIALVETLNHTTSMAFVLMQAARVYAINGDRIALLRVTGRMIELAGESDMPATRSIATFFSAWANAVGDAISGGLAVMESEFPRASKMHSLPQLPVCLLAGVRLECGQAERALELLDSVSSMFKEPGVGIFLPEVQRLRAECLLRLGPAHVDEAAREFETAIATARQQRAHLYHLRAAVSLANLYQSTSHVAQALAVLGPALDSFEPTSEFAEILEARAQRAELEANARL